MTIDLVWSGVSDQTGPRGVGRLDAALTITAHLEFPVAKRGACFFDERSRGAEIGGVLYFLERIVSCPTKLATNNVAAFVGCKFKRENIPLVRPSDGSRLANAKDQERQK